MPTTVGGETISERLTRLRVSLANVRETIRRAEVNGASFNIGGTQVSQIAYERATRREKELQGEIKKLENRLSGNRRDSGMSTTVTRFN
ncbi:hypothetical protein [Cerasicoccus arenae]|uniref:Uncharacterized protein n=1 Tax=Cerasicoccus arenae TaxID=424488 RepID=A0A8J3DC73_9BACT|nr:hypothetical protein [Cerasicoccus arenae]MBK1858230.1 hypothetical protein [Cerasicoccus arenae]GHC02039.1 hypothetical protein GCM10007047_18170 [Cerasicoccus arenae]